MTRWYVDPANPMDAVEIASLYRRVWVAYRGTLANVLLDHRMPDAGKIERLMDDIPYFIVRSEGRIVSVARAKIEFESCYLERMVVDAEFRRKGVGTALVEHVVDYARKNGANKVFLDTSPKLCSAATSGNISGARTSSSSNCCSSKAPSHPGIARPGSSINIIGLRRIRSRRCSWERMLQVVMRTVHSENTSLS